jgi:hypothetical protein
MIYVYESADGLKLSIQHLGEGEPPRTIDDDGRTYSLVHEGYDPQTDTLGYGLTVAAPPRPSLRDGHFLSRSRSRWDRFHKGEFNEIGQPLMTSRREAKRAADAERYETGVDVRYGEL